MTDYFAHSCYLAGVIQTRYGYKNNNDRSERLIAGNNVKFKRQRKHKRIDEER